LQKGLTMLEDLGNLGDFLGGIGVVITLLYLAFQIKQNTSQVRQNTKAVSAAAHNNLTENLNLFNETVMANEGVVKVLIKADHGLTNLTEVESMRFLTMSSTMFRSFENIYHHHAAGLLSDEQWRGWRELLVHNIHRSQGHREFWARAKTMYTREFQEMVEAILAEVSVA
jgi:hypothetical protein